MTPRPLFREHALSRREGAAPPPPVTLQLPATTHARRLAPLAFLLLALAALLFVAVFREPPAGPR